MSLAAQVVAFAFLVTFSFTLGLETRGHELVAVLRRPWALLRALLVALVAIPLATWLAFEPLPFARPVAGVALLLALAPGAPFVPFAVRKAGGSLPFATALNL